LRKILKSNRGVAAVEMALILPLLLVMLFGIIEFGAVLYNKAVITNASREGARFAAGFYTNPENATAQRPSCDDIRTYVTTYVQKHFLNFKSPNPQAITVTCPATTPTGYAGYVDTVSIDYTYDFLILGPLVSLAAHSASTPGWSTLTLSSQTTMRDENQGS